MKNLLEILPHFRLQFGWISDEALEAHADLRELVIPHEGIIAVDDRMVVKRLMDGFGRFFFVRGDRPYTDEKIDKRRNVLMYVSTRLRAWRPSLRCSTKCETAEFPRNSQ